ncbi:MAG TPA: LON peptidase substrate-binding domain-containing protein [Thermoanaerobaculia bacterium]|nr:LON peptidase substrate-binding domain-containing protein [Thermoanaerobaculia bacterium]
MADRSDSKPRLPLVPLPDVVHFPRTALKIRVADPRYLRLVRDLLEQDEEVRWAGVVLLKPGWVRDAAGRPEIFPGGTAGRLVEAEPQADGTTQILLLGDFRFELEAELPGDRPYRSALVRPVQEPWLNEQDPGILAVRRSLVELAGALATELGERFPFDAGEIEDLAERSDFEELINRLAAGFDLPPLRKLQLLSEALPERGESLLSILRHRQQVLDSLRPYRHLAGGSEHN